MDPSGAPAQVDSRSPFETLLAGPDRVIVPYPSGDDGGELDGTRYLAAIADDARLRADEGWTLISLVALPLRQGGVAFGLQGSGITTKAVVGGLYARSWPAVVDPDTTR
jgi:hypothetical protein